MHFQSTDINEIEEGLYLSSRKTAEAEDVLEHFGITHILTVDSWPLQRRMYKKPENYTFLYFCKNDEENVDLMSHFAQCNDFIRSGKTVLVHCYVGVSRSATIVIAYLMNKYRKTYEDALALVKAKRLVGPNEGFVHQLRLYEQMNFTIDKENQSYQLLTFSSIAFEVGCHMGFVHLPEEDQTRIIGMLLRDGADIRCRNCRHPLTSSKCVIPHLQYEPVTWRTLTNVTPEKIEEQKTVNLRCSDVFMVPSRKIMEQCRGLAGKIFCPKCTSKVGRYGWMEVNCDCGGKMYPGFALSISKIDQPIDTLSLNVLRLAPKGFD